VWNGRREILVDDREGLSSNFRLQTSSSFPFDGPAGGVGDRLQQVGALAAEENQNAARISLYSSSAIMLIGPHRFDPRFSS